MQFKSTAAPPCLTILILSLFLVFAHAQSSSLGKSSSVTGTSTGSGSLSSNSSSSGVSTTSSAAYPSLSGYSTCVTNCLALAVSDRGCISVTEVDCYCNKTNAAPFKREIMSCVQSGCATELGTAEQLAQKFCMVGNSSTSLSFPPITSSYLSSSSLSSVSSITHSSSSSTPSPSSNGVRGISPTSMVVFGVCFASVLIGTFFV